ncbi:MAG: alpha/beta fold hydrolase [Verrucomicrobiaceae bacterium]|nr:alpha/beta fold hydrolase [Verrucomicrobiaceae bacterium]
MLLHGHSGCKEDHLPVAERLCAAGLRCLLVDLPAHGTSPIKFATFGRIESTIPREVLLGAAQTFGFSPQPAVLFGVSQGGAIALLAAHLDPTMWAAVAEISAFASLDRVIDHKARGVFGPLGSMFAGAINGLVKSRASFHPSEIRPLDVVRALHIPVLVGHGEEDTLVTLDHAEEIFRAAPGPGKDYLLIKKAGHSDVFVTNAPVYKAIAKFLLGAIQRPSISK